MNRSKSIPCNKKVKISLWLGSTGDARGFFVGGDSASQVVRIHSTSILKKVRLYILQRTVTTS